MTLSISAFRPAHRTVLLAVLLGLGAGAALPAAAQDPDRFPQIRMTYRDLALDSAAGRQALVERIQTTATAHCAQYGPLIMPYERRLQPRYCISAVRGELLGALPGPVRAAYDRGRRDFVRPG
jgi:UrcA family protein